VGYEQGPNRTLIVSEKLAEKKETDSVTGLSKVNPNPTQHPHQPRPCPYARINDMTMPWP